MTEVLTRQLIRPEASASCMICRLVNGTALRNFFAKLVNCNRQGSEYFHYNYCYPSLLVGQHSRMFLCEANAVVLGK